MSHVLVMGPVPNWKDRLPDLLARQAAHEHDAEVPRRSDWMLLPEVAAVDRMLKQKVAGLPGVTYFSTYDALCDATGCLTTLDGTTDGLIFFDYGHLTLAGATYVAQKLVQGTGFPNLK